VEKAELYSVSSDDMCIYCDALSKDAGKISLIGTDFGCYKWHDYLLGALRSGCVYAYSEANMETARELS
jgi:hypothetical protein